MKTFMGVIEELRAQGVMIVETFELHPDEVVIRLKLEDFHRACLFAHKTFSSAVMAMFAADERVAKNAFEIYCVFLARDFQKWCIFTADIPQDRPLFPSLARDIHSASFFEREIQEMFGLEPQGHPDKRRLHLHDEVWPKGLFPLRKDFVLPAHVAPDGVYGFNRVAGEGIFEVPVGPVHAGIIGPGHFRFSAAGEPIVNLEIRLGFTHRGVEKVFEHKTFDDAVGLAECVAGDTAFGHSWAFCQAVEKASALKVPARALYERAICLELERLYNHFADIGGIAVDVGFSFAAQFASVLKEKILRLNQRLTGSRYLKGVNRIGGVRRAFSRQDIQALLCEILSVCDDHGELKQMLLASVSFMDRVDDTGVLRQKTARDLGIVGLAARASGIAVDLRKTFPDVYAGSDFRMITQERGDVLSRLRVRMEEVDESARLIIYFADRLADIEGALAANFSLAAPACALGAVEAWRGPVLYWVKVADGQIDRCKIVDPSFHNWPGLSFAVLGNIIPDFPVCNKSFDLSYAGNDL
ncbi:formate hydrogenlyase subunit 5 [Candidatus Velamenicoccus archaeovorus]|uniref:Formate hydrogenlyase subunit 5 n=1 Tax=Velamenicoccus archaeovorus TaxID=1930593 RepID=A0A410P6K2_VELA1|nr:NADH-quinone oxidoreductase subunit C [Candidatus Velamenicoccus archaeovorus]QAT17780.1 formate hydrogenlyase subunit 5 [Candidatus Velamenicoccus archaeovorus]